MRLRIVPLGLAVALLMVAASPTITQAIDWPTYQLDNTRGGYDSSQPGLASVAPGWSTASGAITGTVMASPIIVRTRVYVATEGNLVYAFDTASGTQQWKTSVGTAVTSGWGCGQPFGGITSTPVADPAGNRLYVAGLINVGGVVNYYLTVMNLSTGALLAQTRLAPAGLDWTINGQRGALAMANGEVYVPFGGRDGDCGSYHGWVIGVNAASQSVISFETDKATIGDAIWATSGPAVDGATGDVLVSTGQGSCLSTPHQGQSVLRLSPTLTLLDTFTEPNWNYDNCHDIDLGSVGPLLLGGGYAFIAGKQSVGYIIRVNALGGIGGQAFGADVCGGAMAFGGSAYAAPYILVPCDNGLVALKFDPTVPSFSVAWKSNFWGTPPIVAGGAVWTLDTGGSGLYVFDLATGNVRYHSAAISVNHFATPAESANTVFVPGSSQLFTFLIGSCPSSPTYTGYFNWYDDASRGMIQDNVHVFNPGTTTAIGCVSLSGAGAIGFNLAPGQEGYYHFPPGTIGGPLTVLSSTRVIPTQRVHYYQSFNEVAASTNADAAMTSYFNWYDHASPGMLQDNIHLFNPGGSTASGTVTVAGVPSQAFSVPAGAENYYNFPQGTIGGPVTVAVTSGPAVIASQRVSYYQSFNEVLAKSAAAATSTAYFNWYDHASPGMIQDNVHLVNPGASTSSGTISITGGPSTPFSVAAGKEHYYNFPQGTIGGPVTVTVTSGPPIIASKRVSYYQSFHEVAGSAASDAAMTAYCNWYDHASTGMLQDNIHLVNPSTTTSTGTISIPGGPSVAFTVAAGQEQYYNFPQGTIGGPVIVAVASGPAVIATQRVTYFQSFNEVAASP